MSLQRNPPSDSGRTEQIIWQFFSKALHTILDARIPSLQSKDRPGDTTPRKKKWFNLALGEPPSVVENLNVWHRNIVDPMIIDVIAFRKSPNLNEEHDHFYFSKEFSETVLERWTVQYEPHRTAVQTSEGSSVHKKMYKKTIVLLRSIYSVLRLLPAFKIFRHLSCTTQSFDFRIWYKITSFSVPFTRSEEEHMKLYSFSPVENPFGRISASVSYRLVLSDLTCEPSKSMLPQIITDYVGSPAAEPLKVFSSSGRKTQAACVPLDDHHSSLSHFNRPHSWTSGLHRLTSMAKYSYPASPSPTDIQKMPPDLFRCSSLGHKKETVSDCRYQSSPLSLSPSPSPPTHSFNAINPSKFKSRPETSPVSIPISLSGKSRRNPTPNSSDPNKAFLPPLSPRSPKIDNSFGSPSESSSRTLKKMESIRGVDLYSGNTSYIQAGQRVFRDSKDDSGRFSGTVSSSGSPCFGFSRSMSRLSSSDDLDDTGFTCPFAVDDIDMGESQSRLNFGEGSRSASIQALTSPRTSHDAAVGVLVHVLRTAPPLRQDASHISQHSVHGNEVGSSGLFASRTATDAMEELQNYKEMKKLILSRSGTHLWQVDKGKSKEGFSDTSSAQQP